MHMDTRLEGWAFVEAIYESSVESCGSPLELRLFDPQFSEHLDEDWLSRATAKSGITPAEIRSMISNGLLKRWPGQNGSQNFTLYSEKQAEVVKQLLSNPRYGNEEVRHIVDEWNTFLEQIVMTEPPYEDMNISDYEHFRRRSNEMVEIFETKADFSDAQGNPLGQDRLAQTLKNEQQKLSEWRFIRDFVHEHSEEELSPEYDQAWRKRLFQLRFVDEFVRIQTAHQFVRQIEMGYSPEVEFDGFETRGEEVVFTNLNWQFTLGRLRASRMEGSKFPLRTPDFNLTERGLELTGKPSPGQYQQLFSNYRLNDLFTRLEALGNDLWNPAVSIGSVKCPECDQSFVRVVASKVYCSDACRNRAKSRRYRQRDPERARLIQARYWNTAYGADLAGEEQ